LIAALRTVLPFQSAIAMVFRRELGPISLHSTFRDVAARSALDRFIASTYVLNPVYNAFLNGLSKGVYLMRDIAPDNYFRSDLFRNNPEVKQSPREELGYITPGWPEGMEEVVLVIPIDANTLGEIGLSRKKAKGGFSESDLEALKTVFPLVDALFRQIAARQLRATTQSVAIEASTVFADRLTPREREVAMMILRGHSTESTGLNLGLSLATVKTHRSHIYRKLQISSQGELFALFLRGTTAT